MEQIEGQNSPDPVEVEPAKSLFEDEGFRGESEFKFTQYLILGLGLASLIYSIHFYRVRLEQIQNKEYQDVEGIASEVQKLKVELKKLSTNRTKNGNFI